LIFWSTYSLKKRIPECEPTLLVMTIGSTKPELNVDIWSGNHPFFTGSQKIIDTEGRVERFRRKYNMDSDKNQED